MFHPPTPGCCCSLHAWPRKNWNHVGLLPREKTENIWDRSHQPDPHTARRLNRNPWTGKGSDAVLSALIVASVNVQNSCMLLCQKGRCTNGLHLKIICGLLITPLKKFRFSLLSWGKYGMSVFCHNANVSEGHRFLLKISYNTCTVH